jgi:hypothetical protein
MWVRQDGAAAPPGRPTRVVARRSSKKLVSSCTSCRSMNGNGLRAPKCARHPELRQALVRAVLQVLAHVAQRQARHAARQGVFGERVLALHRFHHHLRRPARQVVVEQIGFLLARRADDVERERHVRALVAEHPVGARRQAVQQAARAQVSTRRRTRRRRTALDARGEADQVQQELPPLRLRLQRAVSCRSTPST